MQHYFLSVGLAAPPRWCEAFPDGQVLDATALMERLRTGAAADRLIWLCTADSDWLYQARGILQANPGEHLVVLSGTPHDDEGLSALNEGVQGYAHEHAVPELLNEVAVVVSHGGLWVGPSLMQRLLGATVSALSRLSSEAAAPGAVTLANWDLLSSREAEVARAVAAGRSNKEVAHLLHISERTVKAHLGAAFEKLGVRDRLQLVLRLSVPSGASSGARSKTEVQA